MKVLCLFWLFVFYSNDEVVGSRLDIRSKMYNPLNSNAACFRRLNGTHQFGCSSNRNGNLGIIHLIRNHTDLISFIDMNVDSMYTVVLYMDMFVSEVMQQLSDSNKVSGVVVLIQKSYIPDHYSPDDVCDNSLDDCTKSHQWNPLGNKFLFHDWPYPIFVADDTQTILAITKCYNDFNMPFEISSTRPLCSLHLKSHMSAAVNSPTCLRRISHAGAKVFKYCDPMGDQNILLPMSIWNAESARAVIVVSARLDTASMFDGLAPGAMTSVTSFVTLLTVAHIFSNFVKPLEFYDKSVIFMLLNGEVQDHIGSSRIVYDIEKESFTPMTSMNFTLKNIESFIEISQIGANSTVFIHPSKDPKSVKIMNNLISTGKNYTLELNQSSDDELPPSSFRIFKRAFDGLPGLIISSYDKEYSNKYYNGLLDNGNSLGYIYANGSISDKHLLQRNIALLAFTIASTLSNLVTGSPNLINSSTTADVAGLVDELLHCYLESNTCKLMTEVLGVKEDPTLKKRPLPLYVGVQPSLNLITTQTGLLLAHLTSKTINTSKENCMAGSESKYFSFFWLNGNGTNGKCINTTLKFTPAMSPAFLIDDYNWTSRAYSTWSESVWHALSIEIFLKPSRKQEIITLSCGLGTSLLSLLIVFYVNKNKYFIDIFYRPTPTEC